MLLLTTQKIAATNCISFLKMLIASTSDPVSCLWSRMMLEAATWLCNWLAYYLYGVVCFFKKNGAGNLIVTKWATQGHHTEDSLCKKWNGAEFHSSLNLFNEILFWIQISFSLQEFPTDNSQFTDVSTTWDIRAVSIEGTVSPHEPYARVLFHLQGQDWMSKRQPLPCVSLHVFHQAQAVHRACHLQVGTVHMFILSQIVEELIIWLSDAVENKALLWLFGCILLKTMEVNMQK